MDQNVDSSTIDPAKQAVSRTRSFSILPSARMPASPDHSPVPSRFHHHRRPRRKGVSYPCLIVPKMIRQNSYLDPEVCIGLKERLYDMYLSSQMSTTDELEAKAIEAADIITTGLPTIYDEEVLLAAAAWVAVVRAVYERLGRLNHDDAIILLAECIEMFESALEAGAAATPLCSLRVNPKHAVSSFLKVYLVHMADAVPTAVFTDLVTSGIRVWQSRRLEFLERKRGDITEADYVDLHNYTIGLGPLFVLLLHVFQCRDLPDEPRALLNQMIQDVRTADLLQLDLIGLKNDMKAKNTFNYVLLEGCEPGSPILESRRTKAIVIHNDAVGSAIDCWNQIRARGDLNVKACAECLLHLIEQHYRWCVKMTAGKGCPRVD